MDLESIKARAEAATAGPWINGFPDFHCTIDHGRPNAHGAGKCVYTFHGWHQRGESTDIYRDTLSAASCLDDAVMVAGVYDYDTGGIVKLEDAVFLANARQDIPDLLAALAASQARVARLESVAQFFFGLLDDIDTVSDMVKGHDHDYRLQVEEIQQRRFQVAATDGYTVIFKDAAPTEAAP